jgi:hypothetical protein
MKNLSVALLLSFSILAGSSALRARDDQALEAAKKGTRDGGDDDSKEEDLRVAGALALARAR